MNSIKTLIESYFYFASKESLNDPNEFKFKYAKFEQDKIMNLVTNTLSRTKNMKELIVNHYNGLNDEKKSDSYGRQFKKSIEEIIDKRNHLFCATTNLDSPLMWAHYTDNLGWAIGFNTEKLYKNQNPMWLKVQYEKNLPIVDLSDIDKALKNEVHNLMDKVFATKYIDWKYENEYRLLLESENGRYNTNREFELDAIEEIIFSPKIPEDDIKLVKKITENWNVRYFKSKMSDNNYQYEILEMD